METELLNPRFFRLFQPQQPCFPCVLPVSWFLYQLLCNLCESIKLLDKLYKAFCDTQRIVSPSVNDWQSAGKVIAKLGEKHGFEDIFLSKIQNDVLIALSAKQIGSSVITNNVKDFLRVKEFVNFNLIA